MKYYINWKEVSFNDIKLEYWKRKYWYKLVQIFIEKLFYKYRTQITMGLIIVFLLVVIFGIAINKTNADYNNNPNLSIQDKIRLERMEVCQQAYKLSNINEKFLYWQIPAVRCTTYITLIYAYESNFWKSKKCIEKNNCWGIKGNWYDTPRWFLSFKTQRAGRLYFATKYFKWHYKKNVNEFINSWSMTDRKTYKHFVWSRWFKIYRQNEYLLLTYNR